MAEFIGGSTHTAVVTMKNPTSKAFGYSADILMGVNKVKMAEAPFDLAAGEVKEVPFSVVMPNTDGEFPVFIDVLSGGINIGSYQAVENIIITSVLNISFTNPKNTRVWAWRPRIYDINTKNWQLPPATHNDPAGSITFRPTGNSFLLYVSEYYRDIDGDMYTKRYGPYLIEAPEILRGDYTWNGGNASLTGEYAISGKDITGTGNRCTVTGVITNVSHRDDNNYVMGEFLVEVLHSSSGLGAAQYFTSEKFIMYRVYDATAHDDRNRWSMVSSGNRITMDLYLGTDFHWYGRNVHCPLEYSGELYSFSGSVVYVGPVPKRCLSWSGSRCTHWLITYGDLYKVTVSSPYLSQFGAVILAWGARDHEIEKLVRLAAPVTNHEFDISEGSFFYLLAHPDPNHPFSGGWVREEWEFNNWVQVAYGVA